MMLRLKIVTPSMIEAKALSKYFDDFCAVDQISFTVGEGKVFAFLGPNGAGKTTTIKMLTTMLKPSAGVLHVNGYDTVKSPNEVRRSFGIVFQDPSLDEELTGYENMVLHGMLYGVSAVKRKERIPSLLKLVELNDRQQDYVKHYSGGMKRRLEIARGLLHEPKILFLDEPTLGLDPQTRNHIWQYIKNLSVSQQVTIFFTTHYMEEAERVADEIAIIDNGKIVAQGSCESLKEKTHKQTLEEAFIALTGHVIREDAASPTDRTRLRHKVWKR
jgi:ABC-2 type transport system ATP-binding protein